MTRAEACALGERIADREIDAARHDPRGEVPDDEWQQLTYGQVAALTAALRGVGWVMVAACLWWHPWVPGALRAKAAAR